MKDRIQAFLQNENKSYAQFADEIGVQPSGISHILSGRNNPSLDFVIKMLHRYPSLSADWLLFGRGSMYKVVSQPTLFDVDMQNGQPAENEVFAEQDLAADNGDIPDVNASRQDVAEVFQTEGNEPESGSRKLSRIVFFYSDKTFTEYKPS